MRYRIFKLECWYRRNKWKLKLLAFAFMIFGFGWIIGRLTEALARL